MIHDHGWLDPATSWAELPKREERGWLGLLHIDSWPSKRVLLDKNNRETGWYAHTDAWQVTCARSEIQIGLWKIHNATQDISVVVHTSAQKMLEDIIHQRSLKPSFLAKISNWTDFESYGWCLMPSLDWQNNLGETASFGFCHSRRVHAQPPHAVAFRRIHIASPTVRPTLDPDEINQAINQAELSEIEIDIIEYVRYIGVFNELSLRKALSMPSKPPALYRLCKACEKIGHQLPDQFQKMMTWSEHQSDDNIAWQGNLLCSIAYTCDGAKLQPENGTSLYHTFVVHKELFNGLDAE